MYFWFFLMFESFLNVFNSFILYTCKLNRVLYLSLPRILASLRTETLIKWFQTGMIYIMESIPCLCILKIMRYNELRWLFCSHTITPFSLSTRLIFKSYIETKEYRRANSYSEMVIKFSPLFNSNHLKI